MHLVGGTVERVDDRRTPASPVMVDGWAEAMLDLARARSRRRHPSNLEPQWAKDGWDEPTEWMV
jgi:hypothetical protein